MPTYIYILISYGERFFLGRYIVGLIGILPMLLHFVRTIKTE